MNSRHAPPTVLVWFGARTPELMPGDGGGSAYEKEQEKERKVRRVDSNWSILAIVDGNNSVEIFTQ